MRELYNKCLSGNFEDGIVFELIVCSHCNLNCVGCDHMAPYAKKYFLKLETLKEQLNYLINSKIKINDILLFGGEPLLHPQIGEICSIIREYLPDTFIQVSTNGLFLKAVKEEQIDKIKESGAVLNLTKYPIVKDYDKLMERWLKKDIIINRNSPRITFSQTTIDVKGEQSLEQFYYCGKKQFPGIGILKEYKFYPCSFAYSIDCINENSDININLPLLKNKDYLDIRSNFNKKTLKDLLVNPRNACIYCNERYEHNWQKGNKEINQIYYTEKDNLMYNYENYIAPLKNIDYIKKNWKNGELENNIDVVTYGYDIRETRKILGKKIDIIIPIYKSNVTLVRRCITSLQNQSIIDDCNIYIIFDNGSSISELFDIFKETKLDIIFLRTKEHLGPGAARNEALKYANSTYLFMLDSDDYLDYNKFLEELYKKSELEKSDYIIHSMKVINSNIKELNKFNFYRNSFIKENHILYPELFYEEDTVFNILVELLGKGCNYFNYGYVYDKLYNSFSVRNNINDYELKYGIALSFIVLLQELERRKILKDNDKYIYNYFNNYIIDEDILSSDDNIDKKILFSLYLLIAIFLSEKVGYFDYNDTNHFYTSLIYRMINENKIIVNIDNHTTFCGKDLKDKIRYYLEQNENFYFKKTYKEVDWNDFKICN